MIYVIGMTISLVCYIVISFLVSKKVKNANDFYVAGRKAPILLVVGSMIASYVSTGLFMGDAAEYYSGIFSPMTILATMQVVGYIYGAVFFGRYLRRSEVYTIPEFFGKRFCSKKLKNLATITSIITMIVYLLSVVQGIGTLVNVITGIDYNLCIIIAVSVFVLVTVISGSSGVLITDTIMFGVFTFALVLGSFVIINKAGGWYGVVENLKNFEVTNILSWHGNLEYMYSNGIDNIIWSIVYGIVWMSVCMVGPWQSSRYLMAKDEHTVVRSSFFTAFGIFILQLLVGMSAVAINLFHPELESTSHVMIWASMNILPPILGVLLLTGVLAAGISSATTFLSLIGSSVANDILYKKKDSIKIGRIAMVFTGIIILLFSIFNPPQIFWILYLGGSIVASSWMPVALASILSKRVTKTGAYAGMLIGFLGCFIVKLATGVFGLTLPVYLDATIIGIGLNIIAMTIGTLLTKVTDEEVKSRNDLFVLPKKEKNMIEIKKTLNYAKLTIVLGIIVTIILLVAWGIPMLIIK